jgi:hypothetical protein
MHQEHAVTECRGSGLNQPGLVIGDGCRRRRDDHRLRAISLTLPSILTRRALVEQPGLWSSTRLSVANTSRRGFGERDRMRPPIAAQPSEGCAQQRQRLELLSGVACSNGWT